MKLQRAFRLRGLVPVMTGAMNVILLLVFYILLSTSFLLHPGVAVELPASGSLLPAMQDPVVLAVTGGPGASVYYEDALVEPDQLGARLDAQRGTSRSRQVVIKADKNAPVALVARVTELALARGFSVALAASPPAP